MSSDSKHVKECSDCELNVLQESKVESKIMIDNTSTTDLQTPGYWINSDNIDFNRKRDNIFSGLLQFDTDHKEQIDKTKQSIVSFDIEPMEIEPKDEAEEESDSEKKFKIPLGIPARNKRKFEPDYIQHPERWKKYSLQDVTDEELSDKSNTVAALTFLEERRLLKNIELAPETNLDMPTKYESFKFKKPEKDQSVEEEKIEFFSPGQNARISAKKLHDSEIKHQVNLNYLNELQKIIETEVNDTNKEELIEDEKKSISDEETVKFKSGKKFNRKNLRDRNNANDS